jgi:hypothetical protein
MLRDSSRASFNVSSVLNDHRSAKNRTGRAQRGPFWQLARLRLAERRR